MTDLNSIAGRPTARELRVAAQGGGVSDAVERANHGWLVSEGHKSFKPRPEWQTSPKVALEMLVDAFVENHYVNARELKVFLQTATPEQRQQVVNIVTDKKVGDEKRTGLADLFREAQGQNNDFSSEISALSFKKRRNYAVETVSRRPEGPPRRPASEIS